jgi:NAD(P)H-hydrate epimerase
VKVLTAAQMREVDRRTIEIGIPGLTLMENAGNRVVDAMAEMFAPLTAQRIAVLCGKGNNGGDGFVIARQLYTRFQPAALDVVVAAPPEELKGDAAQNYHSLIACGCPVQREINADMRRATVVVDALLGTGISGPVTGPMLDWIREINSGFPLAKVIGVDLPSGMPADSPDCAGELARADCTVTFTAPKICHVLPPNCDLAGRLVIAPIGSPPELFEQDESIYLSLIEPHWFHPFVRPRERTAHKGDFGHVLIAGGSRNKPGAAAMAGMAALRSGAGLVTVASAASAISSIGSHAAELMTEPLPETETGGIAGMSEVTNGKDVIAIGPGLGTHAKTVDVVRKLAATLTCPLVIDADGLNALAGAQLGGRIGPRILTPHPGEMSRLTRQNTQAVQADRIGMARAFATEHHVTLVLKGYRTVIAFPDGRVWINPTGTPALATGGTGDILTGLIAGLVAQFPGDAHRAAAFAVWLHGRCGEIGERQWGDKSLVATDLLACLPEAIRGL